MKLQPLQRSCSEELEGLWLVGATAGIAANWSLRSTRLVDELIIRSRRTTLRASVNRRIRELGSVGFIAESDLILIIRDSVGVRGLV